MQGFSRQNLYYSKNFYEFYAEQMCVSSSNLIVPQVEGQLQVADNCKIIFDIPWGHQKVLISKAQNIEEALFYAHQTLTNSWSRSVLENQIKLSQPDYLFVGCIESQQQLDQCSFPASACSHDGSYFVFRYGQINVF